MLNDNEKKFIDILNEFKGYVKGELELDKIGRGWFPLDYREDLGDAFYIETDGYIKPLITDKEAKEKGIDIIKCCNECNIFYCVE